MVWGNAAGHGESRENDGAYSYTVLEVDLDLPAIAGHYATQLEKAGWARTDEGTSGPQAWSAWTLTDKQDQP